MTLSKRELCKERELTNDLITIKLQLGNVGVELSGPHKKLQKYL